MKTLISNLTEKVTLLKSSTKTDATTVNRFEKLLNTRAHFRAVNSGLFEVTIQKLPAKFKNAQISALKWNDAEYIYISPISEHKENFLKGKVKLWKSK